MSIAQGVSSNTQARFTVVVPKNTKISYFLKEAGTPETQPLERISSARKTDPESKWAVDHLEVTDLIPTISYQLVVKDQSDKILDIREFRPLNLDNKTPRAALISCTDHGLVDVQQAMWSEVLKQNPNLIFMLGDNVYSDRGGDQWQRYVEMRNSLAIYKSPILVPIFATWDDHDYGKNDGDSTFAAKGRAKDIFLSFFPQTEPTLQFTRGPGVSSRLTAFGLNFVFLDNRSFRSPNGISTPDQTHFGLEQEAWLRESMSTIKTPLILISGDQFFGGYHPFESYQGNHPKRFDEHLLEWRRFRFPIMFWSGDRHLSEIISLKKKTLGYSTYEVTSSALHAKVYANSFKRNPNPNFVAGVDGQYNFVVVDWLKIQQHLLKLKVSSYGLEGKMYFSKQLTIKH